MHLVERLRADFEREDPFWPAQLTTLAAILLYLSLPNRLTVGPSWLLPIPEGLLLLGLFLSTPRPGAERRDAHRSVALVLTGVAGTATAIALALLAHYLVQGGRAGGRSLLGAGVVLWGTIVLISALAYWELDRGGPGARRRGERPADFLFVEMTDDAQAHVRPRWMPSFVDYLYLSLTNATAFSPTDTMPLTARAKLVMGVQAVAALATLGLIVARAVNILA
jgi:uncharacterized membrane protein